MNSRMLHTFQPLEVTPGQVSEQGTPCAVCGDNFAKHHRLVKGPVVPDLGKPKECSCCCAKRTSSEIAVEWAFYGFLCGAGLCSFLYAVGI